MAKLNITKSIMDTGMMAAGAIAGNMVQKQVLAGMNLDPMISNGIVAAGGVFLTTMKSPALKSIGQGMAVIGMVNLVSGFLPEGMAGSAPFAALGGYGPPMMQALAGSDYSQDTVTSGVFAPSVVNVM